MEFSTHQGRFSSQSGISEFDPNPDSLLPEAQLTPTNAPAIFPGHHVHLNPSIGVSPQPPQYLSAQQIQQFPQGHGNSQPSYLQNDTISITGGSHRVTENWYSTSQPRVSMPFSDTFGYISNTSTTDQLQPDGMNMHLKPSINNTILLDNPYSDVPIQTQALPTLAGFTPQTDVFNGHSGLVSHTNPPGLLVNDVLQDPTVVHPPSISPLANSSFYPYNTDIHHQHPEIGPGAPPPSNTSSVNYTSDKKTTADAQTIFNKLVPLLETVHSGNFAGFLIEVLKECHHHISLHEMYCVIYSSSTTIHEHDPGRSSHYSETRVQANKLLHLVLGSFRNPDTFQNGLLRNSLLYNINLHEVQRNFLAMKIIFGCITQVADQSLTLARSSIYKVYYILCQKLIQRYPEISEHLGHRDNLIVGKSKLGVLNKSIHPDLVWKRLGKRGESKVHYVGLTWNRSIVDDEIIAMIELEIPQLREHFQSISQPIMDSPRTYRAKKHPEITVERRTPIKMSPSLSSRKPLYSFVELRFKYPDLDCSPRAWNITPNMSPRQSVWAAELMKKSGKVLAAHGVSFNLLMANINDGIYSVDRTPSFSDTVVQSFRTLLGGACSKDVFLHLYLVAILLIFPVTISSDREVSSVSKAKLRASMKECVNTLENEFATFLSMDQISLTTFTRILRKMIHINEMTSCNLKLCDRASVFQEMVHDVKFLTRDVDESRGISAFEDMYITATIHALNAYNYDECIRSTSSELADFSNLINIGKAFQDVSLLTARDMMSMQVNLTDEEIENDAPYQVFNLSAKLFHEVTLSYPGVMRLPIPIITFIILHATNQMQHVSFGGFAERGPDLSKETFKSWWVFSSMFQEYMCVISEVVALSQILD
ncbi:hypothetical protein JCM33374_g6641 [Metschnikowia sp. JCM 33374]|nr:hypothetical protein JCM33374_g6641 [Metschnikowia sp. JCM 33374]